MAAVGALCGQTRGSKAAELGGPPRRSQEQGGPNTCCATRNAHRAILACQFAVWGGGLNPKQSEVKHEIAGRACGRAREHETRRRETGHAAKHYASVFPALTEHVRCAAAPLCSVSISGQPTWCAPPPRRFLQVQRRRLPFNQTSSNVFPPQTQAQRHPDVTFRYVKCCGPRPRPP